MCQQPNSQRLYKRKYHIVFYDINDEDYIIGFDNVSDMCIYKGWEVNKTNLEFLRSELCHALKREGNTTRMLTGKSMRVYLIDVSDDE